MAFIRSIGRWTMTALVINCIIGGGIFGVPGELNRLLGRASPFAMILAALGMSVIMACIAEVASQFSEPGGPYLYVRTAFGRFLGMQIGWFHLLAVIGAVAALAATIHPLGVIDLQPSPSCARSTRHSWSASP
jgi:APA family basic amino acid/polyamine antiporter